MNNENVDVFYPDLGDLSTPEPGKAEGLTLKPYEFSRLRKNTESETPESDKTSVVERGDS
jgi:hypothetical protein